MCETACAADKAKPARDCGRIRDKLTDRFAEMTPDKRPQDPYMDGTGLRFETMEHGGE